MLFFKAHPLSGRPTRFIESHLLPAVRWTPDPASSWAWRRVKYARPTGSVVALWFNWASGTAVDRFAVALAASILPPPPQPGR